MKKTIIAVALAALSLAGCGKVLPGYIGIPVNQFGSSAGVSNRVLGVGTYFTPIGTKIYEYPVFTNTYTYSQSKDEGKNSDKDNSPDEEFNFQDKSGLALSADIGVSYSVDPSKAAILFQKYRVDSQQIVDGPLRNAIRDSLITRAAQLNIDDIYGPRKAELLANVQNDVQRYFNPYGLRVERLFWASNVRMPEIVLQQINARIANDQAALAARAQVATVQANADQAVAEATGKAKSIQIESDALNKASPSYIQLRAIEAWEKGGAKIPEYWTSGSALPFVGVK